MIKLNIGDTVASLSHPFNYSCQNPIISGEHLMVPPLMVVIEMLTNTRDEFSENDGSRLTIKDSSNCKCMWFSSKTNQFEEAWFHSAQLKVIEKVATSPEFANMLPGTLVSLKTLKLETGKEKSSLMRESRENANQNKTSISSLLSFVPPLMYVLEVKKIDDKEKKYDSRSGTQKRFTSTLNAKCKWYSPNGEKFTEKFIPVEALLLIPKVSDEKFSKLSSFIEAGSILKLENSLIKPISISFNSGFYSMTGFDFIKNSNISIAFVEETPLLMVKDLYLKIAPDFQLIKAYAGDEWNQIHTVEGVLNDAIKEKLYLRIKYKNREEKISVRTISSITIYKTKETLNPVDGPVDVSYVEAYCHTRQETRFFRLDRILHMQQLNLKFD